MAEKIISESADGRVYEFIPEPTEKEKAEEIAKEAAAAADQAAQQKANEKLEEAKSDNCHSGSEIQEVGSVNKIRNLRPMCGRFLKSFMSNVIMSFCQRELAKTSVLPILN